MMNRIIYGDLFYQGQQSLLAVFILRTANDYNQHKAQVFNSILSIDHQKENQRIITCR